MALRQCGVNSAVTATKASAEPGSKSTPPGRIINAFTGCNVFEKVLALYQFLKDYLNHLGVLLTAIVIVLACSLRALDTPTDQSSLFDWLHGTLKRNDRVYGEDIFGGKGKKMD